MFRIPIAILLLLFTAAVVCPQRRDQAWLNGTWEGTGYQIDDNTTWTMRLRVRGNRYLIEYPSLKCAGRWQPISISANGARFREKITLGLEACTDKGIVVIERLSHNQIAYRYSNRGTTEVIASAILNRQKVRAASKTT